jgi:hypothetical protein
MQSANFKKAGLLALFIAIIALASWEIYLRHKKVVITYDDNEALFADKRLDVYRPSTECTVFIGASRIKYDLDIPTWEALTGNRAIMLANVGSNPRPVLEDLANDSNFRGRLVIDVTEGRFFAELGGPNDAMTAKKIAYTKKITPTQRFSFQVDHFLESRFVFLDQDFFSLNPLLEKIPLPPRPGVFGGPDFPFQFHGVHFSRQAFMTPEFMADSNLQNQVKAIWMFFAKMSKEPPVSGKKLEDIFQSIKMQVDKIKARGGDVLFVRTPSSGPYRQGELHGFPRAGYWDRLLSVTGCPGIHYEDYPETAHMICPEWSHLSPDDAIIYTKSLIKEMEEKGWSFNQKSSVP